MFLLSLAELRHQIFQPLRFKHIGHNEQYAIGSSAMYRRARRDTPTACTVPIRFAGAENCFIRFPEIGRIKLLGSFLKGEAKKASN
jgi:hypothetical protein